MFFAFFSDMVRSAHKIRDFRVCGCEKSARFFMRACPTLWKHAVPGDLDIRCVSRDLVARRVRIVADELERSSGYLHEEALTVLLPSESSPKYLNPARRSANASFESRRILFISSTISAAIPCFFSDSSRNMSDSVWSARPAIRPTRVSESAPRDTAQRIASCASVSSFTAGERCSSTPSGTADINPYRRRARRA